MSGEEMKHVSDARRDILGLLELKSLSQSVKSQLRGAKDSLQRALDWAEDESGGGSTDD